MFSLTKNSVKLLDDLFFQNLAQLFARFLRERMLMERRRFSFETVFSHESNIDIMRRANDAGYKVYLYFVSTESPEINKYRVQVRVKLKGHAVPEDKIESRYYRSLGFLYEAAEFAYQCYFFDNSIDEQPFRLVNHFKRKGVEKIWDTKRRAEFTNWFIKYYWNKRV
jgi:predicted ABC-type ATPase